MWLEPEPFRYFQCLPDVYGVIGVGADSRMARLDVNTLHACNRRFTQPCQLLHTSFLFKTKTDAFERILTNSID
jgi:hypothetical protein